MAANSRSAGAIAGLGKRITDQIWTSSDSLRNSVISSSAPKFRAAHTSVYDKNPEEQVRPSIVPDDVIQPQAADKYWAPHPQTGVFGPTSDNPAAVAAANRAADVGNYSAAEEEKAWFRPTSLEDSEKPHGL
ncbi:late embryogenesis abundant protein At5g17165 isoform X2 [Cucumis melo]|uniref:Late embryogenesis abundant protein At5g17165 isoform X2 n=1 Tax=Cucumis melo TaxID=3656 RepID=A0ABM3KZL7_CUCME|nr:late embryogenesis abundant protein At5g17165 isoform X2 [Cucumis melo]